MAAGHRTHIFRTFALVLNTRVRKGITLRFVHIVVHFLLYLTTNYDDGYVNQWHCRSMTF